MGTTNEMSNWILRDQHAYLLERAYRPKNGETDPRVERSKALQSAGKRSLFQCDPGKGRDSKQGSLLLVHGGERDIIVSCLHPWYGCRVGQQRAQSSAFGRISAPPDETSESAVGPWPAPAQAYNGNLIVVPRYCGAEVACHVMQVE